MVWAPRLTCSKLVSLLTRLFTYDCFVYALLCRLQDCVIKRNYPARCGLNQCKCICIVLGPPLSIVVVFLCQLLLWRHAWSSRISAQSFHNTPYCFPGLGAKFFACTLDLTEAEAGRCCPYLSLPDIPSSCPSWLRTTYDGQNIWEENCQ